MLNNILLCSICAVVLTGTTYPLFAELLFGAKLSVGPPYFQSTVFPLAVPLFLAMSIGPVLPWKRAELGPALLKLWWAALIAATTKTETHTPALNAECTILLPDLLLPNLLACGPTDGGRYTPALPSSLRCRNLVNRLRTFEWSQHSLAQNTCQPFSGFRQSNRRSNERPRGNVCAPD